jgi:hypothetical protein
MSSSETRVECRTREAAWAPITRAELEREEGWWEGRVSVAHAPGDYATTGVERTAGFRGEVHGGFGPQSEDLIFYFRRVSIFPRLCTHIVGACHLEGSSGCGINLSQIRLIYSPYGVVRVLCFDASCANVIDAADHSLQAVSAAISLAIAIVFPQLRKKAFASVLYQRQSA